MSIQQQLSSDCWWRFLRSPDGTFTTLDTVIPQDCSATIRQLQLHSTVQASGVEDRINDYAARGIGLHSRHDTFADIAASIGGQHCQLHWGQWCQTLQLQVQGQPRTDSTMPTEPDLQLVNGRLCGAG
jgi:hypothetical protein